jgi:hypothetical protein
VVIYCHKAEQSTDFLRPSPVLLGREEEPGYLLEFIPIYGILGLH